MGFLGKSTIDDIDAKFNFEARRRSARIVVIDDDPNSFDPFRPLQREGYAIDFWETVRDLGKLEQGYYDIIVLDIRGVGADWSAAEEGFGILELLKARNPVQIVVAYSGETFDFSKGKFYKMADDMIPKAAVDPAKCKHIIDNLIATRLSPRSIWDEIRKILARNGVPKKRIDKLECKVVTALQVNRREDVMQKLLEQVVSDREVLASMVILIAKLCIAVT